MTAKTLRGLVYFWQNSPRLTRHLTKILKVGGKILLLIIILPLYRISLGLKKIFNHFYAPQKSRHHLIHFFSRRYLTHFIIIMVAIFTVGANLNAYEVRRSDFGNDSIVGTIVAPEDLGGIEEEGPILNSKKISRYLGQNAIGNTPQASEGGQAEETLPSTVAGGSAVVSPILSPIEEDLRQRDKITYYTIQNGDTISEIAEKFGITTNTILWENNMTAYSVIRPGDSLTILPASGIRHKVSSGETVAGIAKKYGVEPDKIIEFNKLASADDIKIGEQLMIPGGKKINTAPSYSFRSIVSAPATPVAPKVVSTGKMQWPSACHTITQYFRLGHSGVDIACGSGKPIYAADAGTVIVAQGGWNGGYGNYIIIDHGKGIQTLYGHLSKIYVAAGEAVTKGQNIAAEGSTGRSTGPHVHFEVRVAGVRKNALYYIQ
ncbi:MAG: M23 family metallopeptidase [Patescibacteria group bacterium]|nr:M23 family metallopeptidase [Patescibacteria group bacterium]